MKKNLLTIFISALLSLIFCYIGFFIYHFFKDHEKNTFLFKSIEQVNFNKFYSDKLHHLRGHRKINEIQKPENYLFTIINNFKGNKKNILIQGDSWIEQLNENENFNSFKEIYNFTNTNNFGFRFGKIQISRINVCLQFNVKLIGDFKEARKVGKQPEKKRR